MTDAISPEGQAPLRVPPAQPGLELPDGEWVTARSTRLVEAIARMFRMPKLLAEHRDLVTTSVRRDLEIRFSGTLLGWLWPLVHPLFLFVVYYFIFTKLLSFKFGELPKEQEAAMGVFMFVGIVSWAGMAEALNRGTNVIVDSGNLIKKLAFPSEILPLNVTLVSIITMVFGQLMFIAMVLATPMWPTLGNLWWWPVLLFLQTLFTYGCVLFLSTLQVFLRDTLQVVGIVTTVWMFLTPIFWVPELIPSIEPYMGLIEANPIYHLVVAWRGCLMGDVTHPLDPTQVYISVDAIGGHAATFSIWAVGAFVVGYIFFVLCQRRFADEV